MYAQNGMHIQKRPESPLVTLWVPHKEKVKAKAELWLSTERVSLLTAKLQRLKEYYFFFFLDPGIKEISVWSLADH